MNAAELIPGFEPETELESRLAADPELLRGLAWGEPRAGHPEGPVGTHVSHLLETLDRCGEDPERREWLRFIALVHDSFKSEVRDRLPRVGENHHAMRARRFAQRYTDNESVLATIELHDRPYALWRKLQRRDKVDERRFRRMMKRRGKVEERGFRRMMKRIPDPELFLRFIELDGSTEGKRPEPIEWFRDELVSHGLLDRETVSALQAP